MRNWINLFEGLERIDGLPFFRDPNEALLVKLSRKYGELKGVGTDQGAWFCYGDILHSDMYALLGLEPVGTRLIVEPRSSTGMYSSGYTIYDFPNQDGIILIARATEAASVESLPWFKKIMKL